MECPACHTANQPAQKYCGSCGHNLEKECPACGATNPPVYNFCGGCGQSLTPPGTIALARSGLIADIDQHAAVLLGFAKEEMAGKPFSLFVAREDLPNFFSHWNELISAGERQRAELALRHKEGRKIYMVIEWTVTERPPQPALFHLSLNPAGGHRPTTDRSLHYQDLLNLIYSLADNVRTSPNQHQDAAISQGLKRICLFLKGDHCFIFTIDRRSKRLEANLQWPQPAGQGNNAVAGIVPMAGLRRSIARLRRERTYIVDDVSLLPEEERRGLLTAFHVLPGALMCQLIFTHKRPIAIIGVARNQAAGEWDPNGAALIKLFGHLVCDLPALGSKEQRALSPEVVSNHRGDGSNNSAAMAKGEANPPATVPPVHPGKSDRGDRDVSDRNQPRGDLKPLPSPGEPMTLEKMAGNQSIKRQRVFVREDGEVLLTCPHCGLQELVTMARFESLGNAISVLCPCRERFAAILEKRRSVRRAVHLEGYFTIAGDNGPDDTRGSVWGPMVVKNLSRSGLRFYSSRVNLVRAGDFLMVRFNLDNSSHALIHKKVQVVSIEKNGVGCRFEGTDEYDATLGFYFI